MADTLLQLRTRARQLADQVNSSFIADAELTSWIEEGKAELYELIVNTHDDYAVISTVISLTPGTMSYALPTDFLKERGVDLLSGGLNYTMKQFEFRERNRYNYLFGLGPQEVGYRYAIIGNTIQFVPTPTTTNTVTLWYVPQIARFINDNDFLPASMALGWERYLVLYGASRMLMKEESDASGVLNEMARIRQSILDNAATRKAGDPGRIVDVRYTSDAFWWAR